MNRYASIVREFRDLADRSDIERLELHGRLLDSYCGPWRESVRVNLETFVLAASTAKLRKMRGMSGEELEACAQDVTELVCDRLFLEPPTRRTDLVKWVFRAVTQEIREYCGIDGRPRPLSLDQMGSRGVEIHTSPTTPEAPEAPEITEAAERLRVMLEAVLDTMPDSERAVAKLKLFDAPDADHAEIAALFDISREAVRKRWQRARQRLQKALEGYDLAPLVGARRNTNAR